jgi:hypothetical protein
MLEFLKMFFCVVFFISNLIGKIGLMIGKLDAGVILS